MGFVKSNVRTLYGIDTLMQPSDCR